MTAKDNQRKDQPGEDKQKEVLNLAEAWKKIYFESEQTLSRAIDEYVASESFSEFLEQLGKQYLTFYKATNQNIDRFFENHPVPTKKDIARVCELVIDVEDKVDELENDFNGSMSNLASSLIKLVDFQAVLKDEIIAVRKEVQSMQKQLVQMQATVADLVISKVEPAVGKDAAKLSPAQPGEETAVKVPAQPSPGETEQLVAAAPPRPRSRKKPTQTKK